MIKKYIQKNNGFVLLYVTILSSVILAVTLGVANVALKEINFGTSNEKTNNAFFAADTGIECALYNDKSTTNVFIDPPSSTLSCSGRNIDLIHPTPTTWEFQLSKLNNNKIGCAKVTINKDDPLVTYITSKGYDEGGDANVCAQIENNIERQLNVSY